MLALHSDRTVDDISERLAASDALAVLLIEAAPLGHIERRYGLQAYQVALDGLLGLVREAVHAEVPRDSVLLTVERGGDTILVFCFRPRSDLPFYTDGLYRLSEKIGEELSRQGKHAVYPYYRDPLILGVGTAIALYNPNVKLERQILQAVDDARHDARLEVELVTRGCNRQLLEVILSREIVMRYESVVDLASGDILGYEALARGPEGSELYTPEQLFGLAERVDLTFELDCLCRSAALAQADCLPADKVLFLNCLPTAIGDPNLRGEGLKRILDKHGRTPADLVIEISEKESIENFAIFREMRDEYQEIGVRIAVDDAGAGYASLESVMEIAPDFLKADMGLVRGIDSDPPRQEVVRGLAAVADRIGAKVIAEGIETEEELRVLRELGIPYGQGFLFGPPLPNDLPNDD